MDHFALSSVLDSDSERHEYDDDVNISSLRFSGEVASEGSGRCGREEKRLQYLSQPLDPMPTPSSFIGSTPNNEICPGNC